MGKWELIIDTSSVKKNLFLFHHHLIFQQRHTCTLYSGQCLWEGTNISEGRGTTLPFETIGAPFLNWVFSEDWNNQQTSRIQ